MKCKGNRIDYPECKCPEGFEEEEGKDDCKEMKCRGNRIDYPDCNLNII